MFNTTNINERWPFDETPKEGYTPIYIVDEDLIFL